MNSSSAGQEQLEVNKRGLRPSVGLGRLLLMVMMMLWYKANRANHFRPLPLTVVYTCIYAGVVSRCRRLPRSPPKHRLTVLVPQGETFQ